MIEQTKMKFSKRTMALIALILIALFSIFVVSKIVTAQDFNASTIKSLDDKKVTVMMLAGIAAASSTIISLIPGDTAMPIANQIAELTSCFLGIVYLYIKKVELRNLAIKLAIFGIILFVAIPASIQVSDLIYDSNQASIEQTINAVEQNKANIEEKKQDLSTVDKNWVEKAVDYVSNVPSKIGNGISAMVKEGEDMLTSFIDAIAIMIITTCVIPIVVILIFAWIIKILFSFESMGISNFPKKSQMNGNPQIMGDR